MVLAFYLRFWVLRSKDNKNTENMHGNALLFVS
jgi:hypothetical protein